MANQAEGRQIGPIGSVARICVGIGLLVAGVGSDPTALEFAAGFVLLPAAELVALLLIRPAKSAAFHLYGPIGYAVNFGAGGALLVLWTTPALFFLRRLHTSCSGQGATPDARSLRCRTSSGAGTISWRAPCSRQSMLSNKRRSARADCNRRGRSATANRMLRWS